MLRLFLCRIMGHQSYAGTDSRRALVYHCARCHRLIDGGMALARRRSW
jgi:hypothetical protein